jgi:hypothetical protein
VSHGGIGVIEEGKLKGRKFIIPSTVLVEKGTTLNGSMEMSHACLVHQKFVPSSGCLDCKTEEEAKQQEMAEIGL